MTTDDFFSAANNYLNNSAKTIEEGRQILAEARRFTVLNPSITRLANQVFRAVEQLEEAARRSA